MFQSFSKSSNSNPDSVISQTEIRRMSMHRIMRHILHLFPYKIQTCQPLTANAINTRGMFVNAMLQKIDNCEIDVRNIWFSDEAYFSRDGFVDKHNWCIWGTENSHGSIPSSMHQPRIIVWASISSRGLNEPLFSGAKRWQQKNI